MDELNNKEYYWSEMYYNNKEDTEYLDIYDDMIWWYSYQLEEWNENKE